MSNAAKHIQRSHKTYSNNASVFAGFNRSAMTRAKMIKANENRSTIIENIVRLFNRFRYRKQGK